MKSGNKGLVILLCVLGVVIVGLGVGIGVLNSGMVGQIMNTDENEKKEAIISRYNEALGKAEDDDERNGIYIDEAFDLKELMLETGEDYCDEIMNSLGFIKKERLSEDSIILMDSIASICEENIVYGHSSAGVFSDD